MNVYIDKNLIKYEEDEEIILINMVKNHFFALDYSGSIIWKGIEEGLTPKEIIIKIQSQFNLDYQEVKEIVDIFLNELQKEELIHSEIK